MQHVDKLRRNGNSYIDRWQSFPTLLSPDQPIHFLAGVVESVHEMLSRHDYDRSCIDVSKLDEDEEGTPDWAERYQAPTDQVDAQKAYQSKMPDPNKDEYEALQISEAVGLHSHSCNPCLCRHTD